MDRKIVNVAMFKAFSLSVEEKTITAQDIKSPKLIKLLAYLLYNYKRVVLSSELIDVIWLYEEVDNPIGALKNLVYRLRTILKKYELDDIIKTGKGSYCIDERYLINIDTHLFEQCNKQLSLEPNIPHLYDELINIYKGRFLPIVDDDHRVFAKSTYYHSLYISRVIEYTKILEKQKDYQKMRAVAEKALTIDKLDESLSAALILSLYLLGEYKEAEEAYKNTVDLLYKTLGTSPSDQLKELHTLIQKQNHNSNTNIYDIQDDLLNDSANGAFYCEYGTFKDLYSMQARMMDRLGVCAHLCLVTIKDDSRYEVDKEKNKVYVEKTMEKIQKSLVDGLRIGDVVSRFSINQFVVLLPACNYEDSQMVMNRVLKHINYSLNNKKVSIDLSVQEVIAND